MKTLTKMTTAAALAFALTGVANAANFSSVPGVSGGVNLILNNGVATLTGDVDSGIERHLAAQYAAKIDGVDRVINLLTSN